MTEKIARLKTPADFRARLAQLGLDLPVDDSILPAAEGSPLANPLNLGPFTVGNRWCIHPMEGWDAGRDGSPTALVLRRWHRFGESGAKLIWGGEAAAISPDARANPNQTLATRSNLPGLSKLLSELKAAHQRSFSTTEGLVVGLQLTHSGRFCRPDSHALRPKVAYRHPLLDAKFGIDPGAPGVLLTDAEVERIMDAFVESANVAREAGFDFVDVKACHGYLLHEFLSARVRPGPYGGDLTGRTRVLTTIIERIMAEVPGLPIGVRLSAFDGPPFEPGEGGVGRPTPHADLLPYQYGFGLSPTDPLAIDLAETIWLLEKLRSLGVFAVNVTGGSPYYNPHIQRPAAFPPSDGYLPPEDPLIGVARHIHAVRELKAAVPGLPLIGTGYTYLQDFLPHVAQAVVRAGWVDCVGIGRMVLSYPRLPADCLQRGRGALERKQLCRTFSDCTTGPRNGLVSGCYPLDPFYRSLPDAAQLIEIKRAGREPSTHSDAQCERSPDAS